MISHRIIFSSIACLSLAYAPLAAQSQQIAPNPNPVGSTITVNTDAVNNENFENNGAIQIDASGFLFNGSTLNNDSGGILNNAGGLINTSGGVINNAGTLNSSGLLVNDYTGSLHNTGTLNTQGPVDNYGVIDNSGMLVNSSKRWWEMGFLKNSGTMINIGGIQWDLGMYNSGTLINLGGMDNLFGQSIAFTSDGQIINNGSIMATNIFLQGIVSGYGLFYAYGLMLPGEINISGSVNPGDPLGYNVGTMAFNANCMSGGRCGYFSSANYFFEIAGLDSGLYDVIDISILPFDDPTQWSGIFFDGGNVEFDFIKGFNPAVGNYWDFLRANNTIEGWDTLTFTFNRPHIDYEIISLLDGGKRLMITGVPEPNTLILLGSGIIGLLAGRRMFSR